MKKIILTLAICGMFSVSAFAQDDGEFGGDDSESAPSTERPKTKEELRAELLKLMKKASEEMGELERELAKASRDAPKADVVAERIRKLREAMEAGKLENMPEGLRKYIEDNPDAAAELLDKSAEELKELAKNEEELLKTLQENPEALKKMAESEETMEKISESLHAAEKKLSETLKRQEESAEKARQNVDDSLEVAHTLRKMQQGGQGEGKPSDNESHTKDRGKEQGEQSKKGGKEPKQGAEESYDPNSDEIPPDMTPAEWERLKASGFQAKGKTKEHEDGSSNDSNRKEPSKYKGFLEKWRRETLKKAEAMKDKASKPKKDGE
ncbi:MAG: hypothetical protein L3J82_07905 [Planctomycetes bacterium]|nr:hypothetical protein [Planctomycetota bacterium]